MKKVTCKICGRPIDLCYINAEELLKNKECFSCNYWLNKMQEDVVLYAEHKAFVVKESDGSLFHWTVGKEDPKIPSHCRGCGGSKFEIKFPDGTVVTSTNLWGQGTVPKHFEYQFKKFIADFVCYYM